jgi:hypothetical protein
MELLEDNDFKFTADTSKSQYYKADHYPNLPSHRGPEHKSHSLAKRAGIAEKGNKCQLEDDQTPKKR